MAVDVTNSRLATPSTTMGSTLREIRHHGIICLQKHSLLSFLSLSLAHAQTHRHAHTHKHAVYLSYSLSHKHKDWMLISHTCIYILVTYMPPSTFCFTIEVQICVANDVKLGVFFKSEWWEAKDSYRMCSALTWRQSVVCSRSTVNVTAPGNSLWFYLNVFLLSRGCECAHMGMCLFEKESERREMETWSNNSHTGVFLFICISLICAVMAKGVRVM